MIGMAKIIVGSAIGAPAGQLVMEQIKKKSPEMLHKVHKAKEHTAMALESLANSLARVSDKCRQWAEEVTRTAEDTKDDPSESSESCFKVDPVGNCCKC